LGFALIGEDGEIFPPAVSALILAHHGGSEQVDRGVADLAELCGDAK